MVSFVSAAWRSLVVVSGLILFSPFAFAVTLDTSEQALEACIARTTVYSGQTNSSTSSSETQNNWESKCVHINPGATLPLYQCVYSVHRIQTTISNGDTTNRYYAGYCSSGSETNTNNAAGQNAGSSSNGWYSGYTGTPGSYSCGSPVWNFCYGQNSCSSKTEFDSTSLRAPTASGTGDVCYQSCKYLVSFWYFGTYPAGNLFYTFSPTGGACAPTDEEPLPVDNTTDPIETDDLPPLDLDPEDGGVEKPVDPGAGRDEDGNGSSSGGGSCEAPPACTGDSIQCNILYQTWSTRCEAQRIADGGGVGGGEEGVGDAVRAASAENSSKLDSLKDYLGSVFGTSEIDTSGPIPGLSTKDISIDSTKLDTSGLGLSRSCPTVMTTPLVYSFMGSAQSIDFSPYCDLLNIVGTLMVVLASYVGLRILLRGDK